MLGIKINKPDVKQIGVWFVLMMVVCQALLASQSALAQGVEPPIPPAPTGGNVVLDTLDWLTPDQEAEINAINKKLDAEGIAQIAVVTFDDCGPDKKTFRYHLFNTWGIGHANDNDGLLILLCWYGGDKTRRSVEQEVGYGLEKTLPSALTDGIAKQYFVTAFQENKPGEGLINMVKGYDSLLRTQNPTTVPPKATPTTENIQPVATIPPTTKPKTENILPESVSVTLLLITFAVLIVSAILFMRVYYLEKTHSTKREEMRETITKRRLLRIIDWLLLGNGALLLSFTLHVTIAIMFLGVTSLFIAAASNWSYRGRLKKNDPNQDTSWLASGHHSSGSSGGDHGSGGGSGFGGGSSGGSGSSTGF